MRIRINDNLVIDDVTSIEIVNVQNGIMIEDFKDPTDGVRIQTFSPHNDNCFHDEKKCSNSSCDNYISKKELYCSFCDRDEPT